MSLAALGLGANLGEPQRQLAQALQEIVSRDVGKVTAMSSLWRTTPWGRTDQPDFLNCCALLETTHAPIELLAALKAIEADLGRTPGARWGPRIIDLDILFYDDLSLSTPDLTLPHKQMFARGFVLAPLAEIAGDYVVGGRKIANALAQVDRRGLEQLPEVVGWPPSLS